MTVDAVVIGAGINGLVASAELAKAGWSVALVEGGDRLGGFIATEERTLPGYLHDTFSSWHPLFTSGPAYAALGPDLHRHGLEYRNTDGMVTASVADDGRCVIAHRDPAATVAGFAHERDRSRYLAMLDAFGRTAGQVGALMGTEPRSPRGMRAALGLLRKVRARGAERMLVDLATSGRGYGRREFDGWEFDQLWAPWLLHAGLAPDQAGGGFMLPVLAATMHGFGLPVVAGGAGRFVAAFAALLDELKVQVEPYSTVTEILVEGGRAVGVRLASGRELRAERAVIASVTPTALYGRLLGGGVPARVVEAAGRYRYGRGAMQVHVALSGPPAWREPQLSQVPLIHVSDGSGSTGIACAQAEAGLLPSRPTVAVGQQFVLDPSRVPDGAAALWLQLQEVPSRPVGDAGGEIATGGQWSASVGRAYADRVLARVAEHAPDLLAKVRAVDVITPADLAAANPNAVGGDPYGGSSELDQNLWWRPFPAAASHRTAVPGLWHIGASTHPGAGLGGGSGHIVAATLTRSSRRRR
ncbi:phytoene desaturase family protein [Pseudonocardia acaciae]|uniref:phytoene desaturase family protein n=1 Tax=Pseudonocardia acaciae TaxID=551276 RepID=UPI0004902620|nr:NAD(P)/FAD-dependent oxidoreductase [Pseudonocardia acaciae]